MLRTGLAIEVAVTTTVLWTGPAAPGGGWRAPLMFGEPDRSVGASVGHAAAHQSHRVAPSEPERRRETGAQTGARPAISLHSSKTLESIFKIGQPAQPVGGWVRLPRRSAWLSQLGMPLNRLSRRNAWLSARPRVSRAD